MGVLQWRMQVLVNAEGLRGPEVQSWEQRWGEVQMCFVVPCMVSQLWSLRCMWVALAVFAPCQGWGCCAMWVSGLGLLRCVGVVVTVVALCGCYRAAPTQGQHALSNEQRGLG